MSKQGPKTAWLDELCDASGAPLLVLPSTVAADEKACRRAPEIAET
jgi:hypothetical protein